MKDGLIIGFNSTKCFGCWGWIIAVENDTIKSAKLNSDIFSYDINDPIPIRLTLGKKELEVPIGYDHFEILCIEKK